MNEQMLLAARQLAVVKNQLSLSAQQYDCEHFSRLVRALYPGVEIIRIENVNHL